MGISPLQRNFFASREQMKRKGGWSQCVCGLLRVRVGGCRGFPRGALPCPLLVGWRSPGCHSALPGTSVCSALAMGAPAFLGSRDWATLLRNILLHTHVDGLLTHLVAYELFFLKYACLDQMTAIEKVIQASECVFCSKTQAVEDCLLWRDSKLILALLKGCRGTTPYNMPSILKNKCCPGLYRVVEMLCKCFSKTVLFLLAPKDWVFWLELCILK